MGAVTLISFKTSFEPSLLILFAFTAALLPARLNLKAMNENKYKALCDLSKGDYKAFLYDCDGTLANNMQAHKDTYVRVALQYGVRISPEIIDEFAGLPIPLVVVEINKRYDTNFDPQEFEKMKSELFYNEYIEQTKPIQFVVDHLKQSAGKYKIGVVSGGSRKMILKTLEVLALPG